MQRREIEIAYDNKSLRILDGHSTESGRLSGSGTPEAETKGAVSAWRDAARASEEAVDEGRSRGSAASSAPARLPSTHSRGPRPTVPQGRPITDYSHRQLVSLAMWIRSDTLLRTEDEMLEEMMRELGFGRRGSRIVAALSLAIRSTQ